MPKPDRRAPPLAAFSHARVALKSIDSLKPAERNARTHSAKQLKKIAKSIRTFGFVTPILIDREDRIVAGHGRVAAARRLGLTEVPTLCITHLGPEELRAYAIADNRLAEMAGWDNSILALEFSDLIAIGGDLDLSVTGFEHAEIDLTIQSQVMASDPADEVPPPPMPAETVARLGDLWQLGDHRIVCGDVRDRAVVRRLMGPDRARLVFTDPPYNVKIDGHVSGLGKVRHAEFACASGEMSPEAFKDFLESALGALASASLDGSLHYVCMDWRHMAEIMAAGGRVYGELKSLCVWNKTNAGMGSFYRSKHELVFVYKLGRAAHTNNIELGRFGRYRSNVWEYAGVNTWRKGAGARISPIIRR